MIWGHGLPHLERHGVVARRVVEDQAADRAVLLGDHLAGRQRLIEHVFRSLGIFNTQSLRAQRSYLVQR